VQTRTLEAIAAYRQVDFTFAGGGTPENVSAVRATPELFAVLKANAAVGRPFRADEAIAGSDRVAVISHGFWERAFGARLEIVGSTIRTSLSA
jgi:hypothetical protein